MSGSATVTFDPAVDQTLTPLPSFTSNLPASYGPFSFLYSALGRLLQVGDACTDFGCGTGSGSDEAYLAFQLDPAGLPISSGALLPYRASGFVGVFEPSSVTVTVASAPVPEPASLTLLGTGLLSLGLAARRLYSR